MLYPWRDDVLQCPTSNRRGDVLQCPASDRRGDVLQRPTGDRRDDVLQRTFRDTAVQLQRGLILPTIQVLQ